MSNPFANGSSVLDYARQVAQTRYHEPSVPQQADAYTRQVYANQQRDEAAVVALQKRDQQLQRGHTLAGFTQHDRRNYGEGFVWERIRGAQWPAQMPAGVVQSVEQAIGAERAAYSAVQAAKMAYSQWEQQFPRADDGQRKDKYGDLTLGPLTAHDHALRQLERVLVDAAAAVEVIEQWQQVEADAPAQIAAEEQRHAQALATIETRRFTARQAAERLGVRI